MGISVRGTCVVSLLVLFACGGSGGTVGGGGDGGSGSSSGAAGSSSGSASSSGSSSGSSGSSGGSSSSGSSSGSSSSSGGGVDAAADAGPCPDVSGSYGQITTTGQGCGDINAMAPECITAANQICAFQLVSSTSGVKPAVNGVIDLQSDGSFSGAALQEGTVSRTGCTGQWDASTQTLTLDCGGMGSSQSCVVTMKRTGSSC